MRLLVLVAASVLPAALFAQQDDAEQSLPSMPEVTIIGDQQSLQRIPGSAAIIDVEDILQFNQSDIQRMIRQVPGVTVQLEDGYGLRPNISIRGTASERSSRVTLLEDGILIAPAPYSAPAAYYFPTAGRLSGIEVLKGPAAITEGPYTIGGAVNLLSTPIPQERSGLVNVQLGEDATWRVHAHYGDDDGKFGWLVETHQWQSDGFQRIDRGGDTGLEKQDYMVKLRYSPESRGDWDQQFDLKLQYADESSDQTYLGLTDADFNADPLRRYGLSALDNIATEHAQILLRHRIGKPGLQFTTSFYHNEFERDWFKTEGIDVTGSPDAQTFNSVSWFQAVQGVNRGLTIGTVQPQDLQAILDGADTAEGAIQVRSNAREYYSTGVEFDLSWNTNWGRAIHNVVAGARLHTDKVDRLQRNSTYTQTNGALVLADIGLLGNAGNQEQEADVFALWLRDEIEIGRWIISPGLRYEDIDQNRTRWETRPGETSDPSSRAASNVRDQRENSTQVVIPGFGVVYAVDDAWSVYAGAHRGFSAPSNAPGVDAEESTNYELGFRYLAADTRADVGVFLTDYDNLVGTCTASSGADCEVGDSFNGDAATVSGLELSVSHVIRTNSSLAFPLQLTYTLIDSEFDTDIADTDFFGDVSAGDPLPYIPESQGLLSAGFEYNQWSGFVSVNFVGDSCARASCDEFEQIDASTFVDASVLYRWSDRLTLTATIENLTDDLEVVGRTPYGARPNKARTAIIGARFAL
ncbi:MAG: TonB-dependent receptor [Pseudomonadota bacterium]